MSSDMPDTAAKLPIIRNSGNVATWLLVRKVVASVAKALVAGAMPTNRAAPTMPVSPMTAASGTCANIRIHMTVNATATAAPMFWPAHRAASEKSNRSIAPNASTAAPSTSTMAITTGDSAPACRAARSVARAVTTACTSVAMPSRTATANMNGACGSCRMTVVRPCCARFAANTPMRHARMRKNTSSRSAPSASSHAATRPVSQRASRSILRLTPPASPAGMQAATATAKISAVISLSAVIAVPASQRISTSSTVTPAAISMPMTPMNAIGRVKVTQSFSSRSASGSHGLSADATGFIPPPKGEGGRPQADRVGDPVARDRSLFPPPLRRHFGAERLQHLGAVGHALRPLGGDRRQPLLPFRFLLGVQRVDGVLYQVARLLPLLVGFLAEDAREFQERVLVDRSLRLRRQRVVALPVHEQHSGVAAERGVEVVLRHF